MTDVVMPRLADGMQEGTIARWLIDDGASVLAGAELVEIETDKATATHQAERAGILSIVAPEGATVAVGEVIARVSVGSPAQPPTRTAVRPADGGLPASDDVDACSRRTRGRAGATPLAHRIAAAHDLHVDEIVGTGVGGRVTKSDVLAAAGALPADRVPASSSDTVPRDSRVVQPTHLQRLVGERMAVAKDTIPHFQVQTDVAIDAAIELRAELRRIAGDAVVPSLNDIVVRACALALRAHPLVNASFVGGNFAVHGEINVGIAIAVDDGLVAATIRNADRKSLGTLAAESRALAERARERRTGPDDVTGATFTVSNLGMYGVTAITPIVNPPQAAMLGVGAARAALARVGGEIVDRRLLTLTLSCDHRILNGVDAARFLADVQGHLEMPLRLAL